LNAQFLKLPDGRRLAYAEYGDPRGHPTLYFHGFPGSRLEAALANASADKASVRLIAADRPGMGGSDRKPGRRLLDWPADVLHLADHLGLARFTVVGVSGGGPYAAVCAHSIPERLDAVAIVSGVAPFDADALFAGMLWPNRVVLRVAQRAPWLVKWGLRPAVILRWFPGFAIGLLAHSLDTPDRDVLARSEVRETIAHSLTESLRQGARGHVDELLILARPWGFRLEEVSSEVHLWHGERDRMVPASHGRRLCEKLPRSHCEFFPGEGHFSLVIDHAAHIFSTLEAARKAGAQRLRSGCPQG
jgi:pimeloyl-ACP methyl ester carboxylesterase